MTWAKRARIARSLFARYFGETACRQFTNSAATISDLYR